MVEVVVQQVREGEHHRDKEGRRQELAVTRVIAETITRPRPSSQKEGIAIQRIGGATVYEE